MSTPARASLLDLDPSLAAALPAEQRELARTRLLASTRRLEEGEWRPGCTAPPGHLGFLLIAGMVGRELEVGRGQGLELLLPGDVLRPAQEDSSSFSIACWRVLQTAELAELDPSLAVRLGRFPHLVEALMARVMQRSRSLAAYAAIASVRGLDERLLTLFWHLAERHGSFTADGVVLPLPLTHQILAELVGARRPSVSVSLGRLARQGRAVRVEAGWLLERQLPPELAGDR
ncbi:MAG TPA: Crp/Fnr family transcriptional regulator [Solirubrobacterales bacterium]|nr:Crp/Fnr family transcriptional regulator [Solirubrobacterales bacterium]